MNAKPFEAWSSHRYMTTNTCFGHFTTRAEAQECIDAKLRKTASIDVWVHPWIVDRSTSDQKGKP